MRSDQLDSVRHGVLARMERADRFMKAAIIAAAVLELLLFAVVIFMFDLSDRLERLVFVTAVLTYTILALGMVALGAHVTRSVGRIAGMLDVNERAG